MPELYPSAKVAPEPEETNEPDSKLGSKTESKAAWTASEPLSESSENPKSLRKQRTSKAAVFGFADPAEIKKRVRDSLHKAPPYSVNNYYYADGYAQRIAKHPIFENTTLAVISLNAVYIAIDTDWNRAGAIQDYDWYFQVMEHLFCIYFTAEIIVRFAAFERKINCCKDAWFVFDSVLVFLMVMETWVLVLIMSISGSTGNSPLAGSGMLRLLRLLRLSRLMRMLRSLPELMILIKGMARAMKSVSYVMCLLLIITYVFAIAFTQLSVGAPETGERFFANVGLSMYSLFIYATFLDDLSELMDGLRHDNWILVFLALIFICLASMTVMNMLIGVLCEVVASVAESERQELKQYTVSEKMYQIAKDLDKDFNGKISYEEFKDIVESKSALQALSDVGVNPTHVVDFSELFFFDESGPRQLNFDEFMEMIMDLQESKKATVKDVLDLWRRMKDTTCTDVHELQQDLTKMQKKVEDKFSTMDAQVNDLIALTKRFKENGGMSMRRGHAGALNQTFS